MALVWLQQLSLSITKETHIGLFPCIALGAKVGALNSAFLSAAPPGFPEKISESIAGLNVTFDPLGGFEMATLILFISRS